MQNPTIISLGGSLIVQNDVDTSFVASFRDLILREVSAGKSFIIITGGGKVARNYQAAANTLGASDQVSMDWVGKKWPALAGLNPDQQGICSATLSGEQRATMAWCRHAGFCMCTGMERVWSA